MKRSKAWQRVADKLSKLEAQELEMPNGGLCTLVARMFPDFEQAPMREDMAQDIDEQKDPGSDGFEREKEDCDEDRYAYTSVYMFEAYDPSPRIMMAQLFALAAEDEGD